MMYNEVGDPWQKYLKFTESKQSILIGQKKSDEN